MRKLLPYITYSGISLSIYTGLLVPMVVTTIPNETENQQMMKSLFSMVTLGIGEIVGSLFMGQVIDKLGNKYSSSLNVLAVTIQTLVTLLFLYRNKFSLMVFGMTFLWGFADAGVNTHLSEILGFEFDNNVEPYSIFNLVQSLSTFVMLMGEAFVKTRGEFFVFQLTMGIIGILCCASSLAFEYKHDKLEIMRNSVILENRINNSVRRQSTISRK
jgi:MFS family permease